MASIDLDHMLAKIKTTQWALADVDWEAPGAELVTGNPELYARLRPFMADLMWIEHVGARAFAAMARSAPTDTLREIYSYFHAEEQRHANAEMALMKRWGMLEGDALPEPNINLRLVIEWLDAYADDMPFYVLGTVIPMLEIALDGALCKFLLDTVDDPVCHQAFALINGDESRHLGVGFSVMESTVYGKPLLKVVKMMGPMMDPRLILGVFIYFPLLNKMRDNIVEMGLSEEQLCKAMKKFEQIGGRTAAGRRNPWYQFTAWHSRQVMNRDRKLYHVPVDALVKLTSYIPARALPAVPSWIKELTYKTAA
ncbi:MAG: ferritin-like domain-containing protein [Pseudomonadota bacterium]